MKTIKKIIVPVLLLAMCATLFVGCGKNGGASAVTADAGRDYTLPPSTTGSNQESTAEIVEVDTTVAEPATDAPVEPGVTLETEAPTEPPVDVPVETEPPVETPAETEPPVETEAPTAEYVGPWTLLQQEPLNPRQSGYEELDNLVNNLIANLVTDDMNGYQKVWACYEWMIDNITYSRGMDANTGAYSVSDPATTPVEVLWATDLLNSGQGCCYNYSSAFVYIMRALGFDAHLITGSVPKYGGGTTPHCWMYVNLGGARYTMDPDLDMNYFNRGENPDKNIWFCLPWDKGTYFYYLEEEHTN